MAAACACIHRTWRNLLAREAERILAREWTRAIGGRCVWQHGMWCVCGGLRFSEEAQTCQREETFRLSSQLYRLPCISECLRS